MKKTPGADRSGYRRKKWNIMFIGEDGRVVTVRHFKGMVVAAVFLLAVLLVAVFTLFHQQSRRLGEMKALRQGMAALEAENSDLAREKEKMLARQVILESRLKVLERETTPVAAASVSGETPEKQGTAVKAEDPAKTTAEKTDAKTPPAQTGGQTASRETTLASVPPVAIANRNLVVCRDPDAEFVRVEYKVINVGPKDAPVSGRSVIVLKNSDMNPEDWIVLPDVPLLDMKPSGAKGKRFRIYNFRTLKYTFAESLLKGSLDSATIFTYTDEGKLLMERDYPLEMTAEVCP